MAKLFSPLKWLVTEAFLITAKSIAKEGDAIRVAALPVAMIPKYGVASDQASLGKLASAAVVHLHIRRSQYYSRV